MTKIPIYHAKDGGKKDLETENNLISNEITKQNKKWHERPGKNKQASKQKTGKLLFALRHEHFQHKLLFSTLLVMLKLSSMLIHLNRSLHPRTASNSSQALDQKIGCLKIDIGSQNRAPFLSEVKKHNLLVSINSITSEWIHKSL